VQFFSIKSAKVKEVLIELEVKNATYSKDLVAGIILYIHTDVYIWWLLFKPVRPHKHFKVLGSIAITFED